MIRVDGVSKCFHIYDLASNRLKQMIVPRVQRVLGIQEKQYFREYWALRNISFELKKGETFGVIGKNGSGKSTLLQIICGTLRPTTGSVHINGRIAALLELGSGFNPDFTGRENIYMNAAILGLPQQLIEERFDAIAAFSDIGDFLDQPVKTYSSGMLVKLAFSVIAHIDADILVIDEALAVGDVFFQQKCMRFLRGFQDDGGTILFVSHDTGAIVNLCDSAMLLTNDEDVEMTISDTEDIVSCYLKELYSERSMTTAAASPDSVHHKSTGLESSPAELGIIQGSDQRENLILITPFMVDAESFGAGGVRICDAWFESAKGVVLTSIKGGDHTVFCIKVNTVRGFQWPAFGFMIKDRLGQYVIAEGSDHAFRERSLSLESGEICIVKFSFLMPILFQGEYSLNVAVAEGVGDDHIQHHWINDALTLQSLESRLVHGICGLHDLAINIQILPENIAIE